MTNTIQIADGVTYEPKAADRGRPAGYLYAKGQTWTMSPYLAPVKVEGGELIGAAECVGDSRRVMGLSKRVWCLMQQADRDAHTAATGAARIDVSAQYEADEAERLGRVAANAARAKARPTLTDRQIAERAYDNLHNEGCEGYNPHRTGDEPTYKSRRSSNERHYPEGA